MVKSCCVFNCFNKFTPEIREAGVSFFRFPADARKRLAWTKAVNRQDWVATDHTYICSVHFVDGWHSDDPSDVNYRPTLFAYKSESITSAKTEESRQARCDRACNRSNAKVDLNFPLIIIRIFIKPIELILLPIAY